MAKVLFIQDIAYEHLGTMYLAAVLKSHGHECDVLINIFEPDIFERIKEFKPDLIAFSVITGVHIWCLDMAKKIKKSVKCQVVFGGPHPTHFPEIINFPQVDFICRGEGEYALLELADNISKKQPTEKIKNIWCKHGKKIIKNDMRDLVLDLDSLPFPDRDLYYKYPKIRRSLQKRFMTTRGCPYSCSFCFNHALAKLYRGKGVYIRRRSVNNVIEEIVEVKNKYGIKTVYFEDDTFILDQKWVLEFLKRYRKEINLPFICLVRANLFNERLASEFKRNKCKSVFFGIETGNEDLRNRLLKKNLSNDNIIKAAGILRRYKIRFKTYNMLGLPDETIENALETMELNAKIRTTYPWCSIFQPYPGTELGKYSIKKHYVSSDFDCNDVMPYFSKSVMYHKKDINEIINIQRLFFIGVKFPSSIPLIKKLIKLPPNFIFDALFILGYAYTYLNSEDISLTDSFIDGLKYIKRLFYNTIK